MTITVNQDGTAGETTVVKKPIGEFRLELEQINNELESTRLSIDRLQERKLVLQARKAELRAIELLP